MTYRELIKACYETPAEECDNCSHKKECVAFTDKADGEFPVILYQALNIDLDAEIDVKK